MTVISSPDAPRPTFRITVLYQGLARDLATSDPPPRELGHGLPSFVELEYLIHGALGTGSRSSRFLFETVEWSFDPSFPSNWIDWQSYAPLSLPPHTSGDRVLLGGNISTAVEWIALFSGSSGGGMWQGSHLKGHLILTISPFFEPSYITRKRQDLVILSSWNPFDPRLHLDSVATLRLRASPPISSSLDLQPTLQILDIEWFDSLENGASTLSVKRIRCSLSDGIHHVRALVHTSQHESFRLKQLCEGAIVRLEEYHFYSGAERLLYVDSMSRLGKLDRVGDPVDVRKLDLALLPTRPTKVVLIPDLLGVLFTLISDACNPSNGPSEEILGWVDLLFRCSLVCREWRMLSLPHLYRHLHITTPSHPRVSPRLFAHSHLVRTMDFRRNPTPRLFDNRLLQDRTFPSLKAIYGLTVDLGRSDQVPRLDLVAPNLRTLELQWPCSDLDDHPHFGDAFSLPTSLEELDMVIDDVEIEADGRDCLRILLETGETALDGTRVKRSLPNLRRLKIDFPFADDGAGLYSPLSFPPVLQNLQLLLAHLGPNLLQLGLSPTTLSEDPPSSSASFPVQAISLCTFLHSLHTFNLKVQDILAEPQRSIEQLDVGPLKLHPPPKPGDFTYGGEVFAPSYFDEDMEPPEGDVVWEIIDHFSRERWPLLKRVRLTLADWEFEKHRELVGLEENVRALRLLGIELVDRWGALWWKMGELVEVVEEKEVDGVDVDDAMKVD